MNLVAILMLAGGLLIWLVCQPLIRRKIPMNYFYGFRLPASFESKERWYEINAYGGRRMAAWSWLMTVTGVLGLPIPRAGVQIYALVCIPVALASVLFPIFQVFRWSKGGSKPK